MLRTKTTESKPVARTPDNVAIKPQRMGFEFGEKVPHYWLDNSYILSHTMNALSVLFPQGEQFFVDSVRYYQDQINDPKLKKEVRGFIGQEAMHSLEHKSMNQHVRDQGMPVEELEEHLEVVLGIAKKLPKRHQLAITCALEHMTAMMADMLLERSDVREDMHETMRPLWVWHAIEETEHKAVTYDVGQKRHLLQPDPHLAGILQAGIPPLGPRQQRTDCPLQGADQRVHCPAVSEGKSPDYSVTLYVSNPG